MNDTPPDPHEAMQETPSATYRKGQLSMATKFVIGILVFLQTLSIPVIGYLVGRWDTLLEIVGTVRQQQAVMESRINASEKLMERVEGKLDQLIRERRP